MESYQIENLTFTYAGASFPALEEINITVNMGEFLLLCGPSGSGKSTLLRLLKPSLSPHGETCGEIKFEGEKLLQLSSREECQKIGFVMQSPENQVVTDKVWHELAFGLESLGCEEKKIRIRVAEMAAFFGMEGWLDRDVKTLSGGQKQLLALASVMATGPSVLLLDEPTSRLDPIAASDFLQHLQKINRELGVTILLCEHHLEEAFSMADRVAVLKEGKLVCLGSPNETAKKLGSSRESMFYALPTSLRIFSAFSPREEDLPLTVREGRKALKKLAKEQTVKEIFLPDTTRPGKEVMCASHLYFAYDKKEPDVLKECSFSLQEGEIFALMGGNGAGKSTLLSLISGSRKPYRGKIHFKKEGDLEKAVCLLPQEPSLLFSYSTVKQELEMGESTSEKRQKLIEFCGLGSLLTRHPYDLSGGEMQKLALAKVLLCEPEILLLDEPTKGMDADFKQEFGGLLHALQQTGISILMVSHDIEFCAQFATYCAMLFDGRIISEGEPHRFFCGNHFYTTAAARMAKEELPFALTAEEVIEAFGGKAVTLTSPSPKEKELPITSKPVKQQTREQISTKKRKLPRTTFFSIMMAILLIPLTVLFGIWALDDRKYYFISLLVLIEIMIPFFLHFEGKKPQAREIVFLALLCALAVAGRAAFYMVPQFKPTLAVIILAGVVCGSESGFLVGALTAFVSNFFFGQGPWTPWQMFAMGMVGLIAGILGKTEIKEKPRALAIIGGILAVLVYGGIMNPSFVLTAGGEVSVSLILLSYVQGFPFDLIHGAGTAIFLWILAKPMLQKFDRMQTKYGLFL